MANKRDDLKGLPSFLNSVTTGDQMANSRGLYRQSRTPRVK